MAARIETVAATFLQSHFKADSFGRSLQLGIQDYQQSLDVLCARIQRLRSLGPKLCREKNQPMFSLYAAALLDELDNAFKSQLDKQTRLLMLAFPELVHTKASPALLNTIHMAAKADKLVVRELLERTTEIGLVS